MEAPRAKAAMPVVRWLTIPWVSVCLSVSLALFLPSSCGGHEKERFERARRKMKQITIEGSSHQDSELSPHPLWSSLILFPRQFPRCFLALTYSFSF